MSTLPPIESNPILFLRFTTKSSPKIIAAVKKRLNEAGVIVFEEEDAENRILFGLTMKQEDLEDEAERCNLYKPTALKGLKGPLKIFEGTTVIRPFEVANRRSFKRSLVEKNKEFQEPSDCDTMYDAEELFNSADRVKLVFSDIEALPVLAPGTTTSKLVKLLNETIQIPEDEIATKFRDMYLFDTLRNHEFIDALAPIHDERICKKIFQVAMDPRCTFPVEAIRCYYGEDIAFYFAWIKLYTKFLLFPATSGLVIYLLRVFYFHETVDTCRLTPFHGLITFFWALVFIQYWTREEYKRAYNWGTSNLDGLIDSEIFAFTSRHEFKGELRRSKVTGKMEKYYPTNIRRLKFAVSALVTLVLLAGAFFVMILSLNAQGFIKPKHLVKFGEDYDHPFHFPMFAALAEKGAIFDAKSQVFSYIPVVLHVALVILMNSKYRQVAEKLTEWENHENQLSYQNSMTVKRFCFEATDCYLVLFYLAFYEQDVEKVRSELVSVFHVDTFRRLLLEGIVPFLSQKWSQKRSEKKLNESVRNLKKTDEGASGNMPISVMQTNSSKEEYEQFDDYIEMIIQLGYITLFASAYPLAAFVAFIANHIELRLDTFKLTFVSLRPRAVPTSGIGTWMTLMKCIVWMSAITNCLIFTFSSMQMMQFFPEYFTMNKDGEHGLKAGNGWIAIFIVFGIERVLLFVGIILNWAIPDIPQEVIVKEKRKRYIDFRVHQDRRARKASAVEVHIPETFEVGKEAFGPSLMSRQTFASQENNRRSIAGFRM